jgi:hypothetical protein
MRGGLRRSASFKTAAILLTETSPIARTIRRRCHAISFRVPARQPPFVSRFFALETDIPGHILRETERRPFRPKPAEADFFPGLRPSSRNKKSAPRRSSASLRS